MANITTDIPRSPQARKRGAEFYLYFTVIFLLALPVGLERTLAAVIRKQSLNVKGPVARAWAEADRITPLIFSA